MEARPSSPVRVPGNCLQSCFEAAYKRTGEDARASIVFPAKITSTRRPLLTISGDSSRVPTLQPAHPSDP